MLCLTMGFAAAVAVGVQGPWVFPPVDVSTVPVPPSAVPQVAVAPDGAATAVWVGADARVAAAVRVPGASTFTSLPGVSPVGHDASVPQVAVAADGTAIAVWTSDPVTTPSVEAAVRPPGAAAFTSLGTLSTPGVDAIDPQVAFAPDGTAVAVWAQGAVNGRVRAAVRAPGAPAFTPLGDVSAVGLMTELRPQVAVAADGSSTVVWSLANGADVVVQAAVRAPGASSFTVLPDLSSSPADATAPQVAVAPDGAAAVVWNSLDGADNFARGAVRPAGAGAFTPLGDLSAASVDATVPQVAVGPDGSATAVWLRWTAMNVNVVQAAVHAPGAGSFTLLGDLSSPTGRVTSTQIVVAADGTATAVWDTIAPSRVIEAAVRPPGPTSFSSSGALSAVSTAGADQVQVAVAPDGAATAVWAFNDGVDTLVQSAMTANPPSLRAAPVVSGTAAVGLTLTCDGGAWTHAASTTIQWLRGASAVASGATYSVAAADAGQALTCRVTATNPYGSGQAASTPLVVQAPAVATPPPATSPLVRALPRIFGVRRVGRTLVCRGARFEGATRTSFRWLRNGRLIAGATRATYKLKRADRGKIITCRASATGPGGTTRVVSLGVLVR